MGHLSQQSSLYPILSSNNELNKMLLHSKGYTQMSLLTTEQQSALQRRSRKTANFSTLEH
jgi:hypothetical protein